MMLSPYENYEHNVKKYSELIDNQNKSIRLISYLRLLTFLVGTISTAYTFIFKNYTVSSLLFIISLGIFIYLIIQHDKQIKELKYLSAFKIINEKSLKRLDGSWKDFDDDGEEFKDLNHSYSNDLDIFGKYSLFQWINTTKTYTGRQILKNKLLNPKTSANEIKALQESISELAQDVTWRQQFEAEGMIISNKNINLNELYNWCNNENKLYSNPILILIVRLLPCLTLLSFLLYYFSGLINIKIPYLLLIVQFIILFVGAKPRQNTFNSICKYKNDILIYFKLLKLIENKNFKSHHLKNKKKQLLDPINSTKEIERLCKIYDKISNRNNLAFLIINIMFLWDYQCIIEFENWRISSGKNIEQWFNVIGEFDALNSLSNINYNNPKWAIPLISNNEYILNSRNIGHPLMNKKICNDIVINKKNNILLITGSNMSGKSTFLRTIGLNLILSYIGTSVCANNFECSIMKILTCMRTSDNLENNISSFYAEILRIKMIVEKVKNTERVLFLLDELFKGTNSIDRHQGAIALIKHLGKNGASGLISTHDLELCSLESEYSKIKNYHFQEYYENNKLKFDYKLRQGMSTSRNGLYLIKLAGIEL